MKAKLYTAKGGETLKDVAESSGVNYALLVRLNKAFVHTKLRKGTKITLSLVKEETGTQGTNNTSTQQQETLDARQAKQNGTAAKKTAQKQEALDAIDAAEKEYRQESAYVNADHTQKVNRLTELMRSNRSKLEGDLARQKIADSSIAENQRNKLQEQEASERLSLDTQTAHKLEQLERKKEKTKAAQNRKLANL